MHNWSTKYSSLKKLQKQIRNFKMLLIFQIILHYRNKSNRQRNPVMKPSETIIEPTIYKKMLLPFLTFSHKHAFQRC